MLSRTRVYLITALVLHGLDSTICWKLSCLILIHTDIITLGVLAANSCRLPVLPHVLQYCLNVWTQIWAYFLHSRKILEISKLWQEVIKLHR